MRSRTEPYEGRPRRGLNPCDLKRFDLREAQLNEALAALEFRRLIASREITEEMNKAQADGMELQCRSH